MTSGAETTPNQSRLRKRSLPSAYLESARLYYTNFGRYFPAIAVPAVILFLLELIHAPEYWMEHPNGAGLLLIFINVAAVFLLSGVLGHLTSHIYVGGKVGPGDALRSALRLVPSEFAAGMIPALGATVVFLVLPHMRNSAGEFRGYGFIPLIVVLWAVSIMASLVVESEGIRNPWRAVSRAVQLVVGKENKLGTSFSIVGVVFLNFILMQLMGSSPGMLLLIKLTVEPPLEIVYGLLYFNLRFAEGGFDVAVLAKQLEGPGAPVSPSSAT